VTPSAPRAPVFARQAAHTPYGFAQGRQQQNAHNRSQYTDLSAPPPPHSLAPVAMGPDATGRSYAHYTGSHRTNGSVMVREKQNLKWAVMIVLTGALLGGVLGLGMDERRQTARAAAAAEAKDKAPPAMVVAALPQAAPVAAPRAVAAPAPAPVLAPVAPVPVVLAGNGVVPTAQGIVGHAPAPVVLAPAPAVVVTPAKAEPKVAHAPSRFAPAPVKPHGFLATKVNPPKAAPEPKEAPEPKAAPEKQAKVDPKPEKTESKPAAKKDANTSDAMKILEAANKDTTNTL
jgi:hypothetical protein